MNVNKLNIDYSNRLLDYSKDNKLISYHKLILEENKKLNLVSRETINNRFFNIVTESLIPVDFLEIEKIESYLDIGSGGGLPSIPVILKYMPAKAVLVERTQKKADALMRMTGSLDVETKIDILDKNYEEIELNQQFDLITLKLVKLDQRLLSKILRNLKNNGIFLYYSDFKAENSSKDSSSVIYSYTTTPSFPDKLFSVIRK